jgi:hypothetical protein
LPSLSKRLALLVALLLVATPASAGLKAIHKNRLPDDGQVRPAYANALSVENLVKDWSPTWRYRTPKSKVASLLESSLAALQNARRTAPKNEELLLLIGLVAHYAYNVDVKGSYQTAVSALEEAHKLSPGDYRPEWFLGIHQCEANELKHGMDKFLAVENRFPWRKLPIGFWDDYITCATLANMPAHVLRAVSHLNVLHAPASADVDFSAKLARNRFKPTAPTAEYPASKVWTVEKPGRALKLTNTMFGFAFSVPLAWKVRVADAAKGTCSARIQTGPDRGKASRVFPEIFVLSRQAKPGETMLDFLKQVSPPVKLTPTRLPGCALPRCRAYEGRAPQWYRPEGGGVTILEVLRAKAPEFPGLLFESPEAPPSSGGTQLKYFRPTTQLHRLPGTLYYLVLLDTARSVLTRAENDYERFLKHMQVE